MTSAADRRVVQDQVLWEPPPDARTRFELGRYLDWLHAEPRAVGFASPCAAFGHRELLAALDAYRFARLKVAA